MPRRPHKLEERLSNTKTGWSSVQLRRILERAGFVVREGKHLVYYHPDHPDLTLAIPRGNELLPVYAREVEKLLDELDDREEDE